jgi:hypothetical protein
LKRTHFSHELSNNKIVRFIYQGQFLNEKATIKSYNIKDQTTIHCHITSKPSSQTAQANSDQAYSMLNRLPNLDTAEPIINNVEVDSSTAQQTETQPVNDQQQQQPRIEAIETIGLHLNHFLLPIFAAVLASCWYFRVNFKHFFSPLSTLILVIFTFLYALFLFNNIHSTSAYAVNNFFMHNRLVHRRERHHIQNN